MEKHRQQTGKNGVDMVSILHYQRSHKSYKGSVDSVRFDTSVTSAYVFKYGIDELNVNLERTVRNQFANAKTEPDPVPVPVPPAPPVDSQETLTFEKEPDFFTD